MKRRRLYVQKKVRKSPAIKGEAFKPSHCQRVKGNRHPRNIGESEIETLLVEQTQSPRFQTFRKNLPKKQSPKKLFLRIIRAFNKHKIPYLVIGGLAVRKYDRARKTEDLDVFVRPGMNALKKTLKILKSLGYSECFYYDPTSQCWCPIELVKDIKAKTLKNYDTVRFLGQYPLDLMIASDAPDSKKYFDEMFENSLRTEVFGEKLSVLHIQDLISSKLKSTRPKDVADKWRLVKILKEAQRQVK